MKNSLVLMVYITTALLVFASVVYPQSVERRISIDIPGMAQFVTDIGLPLINPGHATEPVKMFCQRMLQTDDIYAVGLINPTTGEYASDTAHISICVTDSPPTEAYGYLCNQFPGMIFDRVDGNEMVCRMKETTLIYGFFN